MNQPIGTCVEYTLKWPITFGSEVIELVKVRRPKGKDMRAMRAANPTSADSLDLIGRLTGQPKAVIDEMDGEDIREVTEIIAGFSGIGRETGDEPTQ